MTTQWLPSRRAASLVLVLALTLLSQAAPRAMAQIESGAVPAGRQGEPAITGDIKYFDFFVIKGGPIAFGLIVLSVVTVALSIEHALSIRRSTIVPPQSVRQTRDLIQRREYVEAVRSTADDPSMLGYVVNTGLLQAGNGYAAMERAIEEMLDERSARLFRKTEYLHIIGNVSPMIGLLGTVTGMIMLFAEIHAADAFPPARIVADRIAVALITTFWGLAVAIPALSIYAVFRNRIDVLTAECALAAEQILAVFKPGSAGAAAGERRPVRESAERGTTPIHQPLPGGAGS